MQVLRDAWHRDDLPHGTVLTVGNYDGVHRGQRAILERVAERARELDLLAGVVTFDPHPRAVLEPAATIPRLTTERQKQRLLAGCGIDLLVEVAFTREFAATPADRFVRELLVRRLGAREVVVGSRFAFGRDRTGDLDRLREIGREEGFRAVGVPEVMHGDGPVSSTRVRAAVEAGAMEEAAALLGRPYAVAGTVVHGDGRGRELGWPTANVEPASELLPADGVYAAGLERQGGRRWRGVANVGVRPTLGRNGDRVAEIHLFDCDESIYGEEVELLFCCRLREERRFASLDHLRDQIARDAREAREYFATVSCWSGRTDGDEPGEARREAAATSENE